MIIVKDYKKIYYWTLANCMSGFGDGFTSIAMSMITYTITSSGKYASIVFLAGIIPSIILGPIVGVIIDNNRKTKALVGSNVASILILALLIISPSSPWIFFVGNFLLSTSALFFRTASRVVLPELADDKSKLMKINSMYSMSNKISRVIGMTVAGFISELIAFKGLYLIDAASFIICIVIVLSLKNITDQVGCRRREKGEKFIVSIKEGLMIYFNNRILFISLLLFGTITMCDGVVFPHLVVYVKEHLNKGGAVLGQIQSLFMIGTIIGQIAIMKLPNKVDEYNGILIGVITSAIAVLFLGVFKSQYITYFIIFAYGLFGALIMTSWITLSQKLISVELRGRGTTFADAIVKSFNMLGIGMSIVFYGNISISQEFMIIGLLALILILSLNIYNVLISKKLKLQDISITK